MASNEHEPDPMEGHELVCEHCGRPIRRAGNWAMESGRFGTMRFEHARGGGLDPTSCGMKATPRRISLVGTAPNLLGPSEIDPGPPGPRNLLGFSPWDDGSDPDPPPARTTGADQLHLFEQRPGVLHNLVAHPMLVLWPRLGEWLHAHTSPTRP